MKEGMFGTRIHEWPYPIKYYKEKEIETDVLVLGGGIAGCWAAISAAKKGVKVAIVEKGATKRSGSGGAGVDHWDFAVTNPCCKVTPEQVTRTNIDIASGYVNGITDYILCSTSYETLLEMEEMGGKIRDTEDEFKGAEFRDEETKLLFALDYVGRLCLRVWGTTFKPALHKECKRLGIKVYDRIAATSLLTEGGKQGARVIGATGIHARTGEFFTFKAKSTILAMGSVGRTWSFSSELRGMAVGSPTQNVGDGFAMAWRAGAEFTMLEKSIPFVSGAYMYPLYGTGNPFNTWHPCTMVDANGKEIPWVDKDGKVLESVADRCRTAPGQDYFLMKGGGPPKARKIKIPSIIPDLEERIKKGEYALPLYADLPSMPEDERRVIWGLMVGEEGKSKVPVLKTYSEAGFDPEKDLLQSYGMLRGERWLSKTIPQERVMGDCGLMVDWDLKSNLEGLYAAGGQAFANRGHAGAATSGRWAGWKAADYALETGVSEINRKQIEDEKKRAYAPVHLEDGVDWKELNMGLVRVMQNYCSEPKSEELLTIGLTGLKELEEEEVPALYADNPHKLVRALEVLDVLTNDQMIIHACMARKASCRPLSFKRADYPDNDPPEWRKWVTIKQEAGEVKADKVPLDYYEPLVENYEAHIEK